MSKCKLLAAAAATLALSATAMAHGGDFDVSPAVQSGKIVTNAYEDTTGTIIENVRIFGFEFGEDPLDPFFLDDPGFHPLPGTGVPGSTTFFGKDFSALSFWTGSTFGALPAGETLDLTRGSTTITLGASGDPGPVTIDTTDANGEFDEHLESLLQGISPDDPSAGIYLFSMTLSASGLTDSDPIFIICNNGADDEDFDTAMEYARDTFAPGSNLVPEPAMAGMLTVLVPMLLRRRRV